MLSLISIASAAGLGAFIYRARGAGWSWWPIERPWNQLIVSLPFLPLALIAFGVEWFGIGVALGLLVLGTVTAGMGHGDYMRLTRHSEGHAVKDEEEVGIILKWLFPSLSIGGSRYWYEFVGLSLTGLIVTLPVAIVLAVQGFILAAILCFMAGFLKGAAYELGWRVNPNGGTDYGEWFFGAVLWGLLISAIWVL